MLTALASVVDTLEAWYTSRVAQRVRALTLALTLIGGVLLIELENREISSLLETSYTHLAAIAWTVTLLLIFEIVELVFSLRRSVATSVGRHLQIFALVLLRDAFAKLSSFPEPIAVTPEQYHAIAVMGSDVVAAVVLFVLATLFERLQAHTPITTNRLHAEAFVRIKKLIVLGLFISLVAMVAGQLFAVGGNADFKLFDTFFTLLVFVDVLLAVVSLGFADNSSIVFRNFGFAFSAIILRLAIASPEFVRPTLGVAAGVLAVGITLAFNYAMRPVPLDESV